MRNLYVLLLCCTMVFTAQAQNYSISPNDTVSMNLALNYYNELNIDLLKDKTADTITFGYTVVATDIPTAWDDLLCVYGICVGSNMIVGQSGSMSPLTGNNIGFVKLTANPVNDTQTATFRIYVYDVNAPNSGDTLTFIMNPTTATGVAKIASAEANVSVFPNPTESITTIQSNEQPIDQVELYALNGQLLHSIQNVKDYSYTLDVSSLPKGIYIVKVTDTKGQQLNQKLSIR
ncbi:MAG: T9SS type A sorting domain-containing protein [Aureispira sp.]|nr:T9SS type A sorting domain-containing protein [Aureispira sp.]